MISDLDEAVAVLLEPVDDWDGLDPDAYEALMGSRLAAARRYVAAGGSYRASSEFLHRLTTLSAAYQSQGRDFAKPDREAFVIAALVTGEITPAADQHSRAMAAEAATAS